MDEHAHTETPCYPAHGAASWPAGTVLVMGDIRICGDCDHLTVNIKMPLAAGAGAWRLFDLGPWNDILKAWDKNWGTKLAKDAP